MYPQLDPRVAVYAPLGPELLDYLNRISTFNHRADKPTTWQLDVHTSSTPMAAMLRDQHQGIVVFSGHNRGKIDNILASLNAGLSVLADKPWIIEPGDMPKLEKALDLAASKGLAAYDIMTERYEVTSQLQRELVSTPSVFGTLVTGTREQPAITARSIHYVSKVVAGLPLRRPTWFFDIADYGDGLADVGTHPVDLIQWIAFPDQLIDYRKDIHVLANRREALRITRAQYKQTTGAELRGTAPALDYECNRYIEYTLRGSHVKLDVLWDWEAAPGKGDFYGAAFHGSRATVEIRDGEVYVVPNGDAEGVLAALDAAVGKLQSRWPGLAVKREGNAARMVIPAKFHIGHEEHFAQVAGKFFEYVEHPSALPAWERAYMLAKYYITTAR